MLFVLKQYEEEVNYKLLTDDERDEGKYFKLNEKAILGQTARRRWKFLHRQFKTVWKNRTNVTGC